MSAKRASSGTPATDALAAAGTPFTLHSYAHTPGALRYGDETIRALGLDPARVLKTLIVDTGAGRSSLAVAVVPVSGDLDLKAAASAFGVKRCALADPVAAERSSGYVVGGISPLGQRVALPTIIDSSVEGFSTVYCSAGRRGLQVELSPAALARLTGARFAPVGRPRG